MDFKNLDLGKMITPTLNLDYTNRLAENIQNIKVENPVIKTNEMMEEQIELLRKTLSQTEESNKLLKKNYDKLQEQYDLQVAINEENTIEIKKSKRNFWISVAVAVVIGVLGVII